MYMDKGTDLNLPDWLAEPEILFFSIVLKTDDNHKKQKSIIGASTDCITLPLCFENEKHIYLLRNNCSVLQSGQVISENLQSASQPIATFFGVKLRRPISVLRQVLFIVPAGVAKTKKSTSLLCIEMKPHTQHSHAR